jgi:hypothetical protein
VRVSLDDAGAATGVRLPVMTRDAIEEVAATSLVQLDPTGGVLAVSVPESGVFLPSIGENVPFYDTGEANLFDANGPGTGPAGVGVYFDVPPGDYLIEAALAADLASGEAVVVADGVTFARVEP